MLGYLLLLFSQLRLNLLAPWIFDMVRSSHRGVPLGMALHGTWLGDGSLLFRCGIQRRLGRRCRRSGSFGGLEFLGQGLNLTLLLAKRRTQIIPAGGKLLDRTMLHERVNENRAQTQEQQAGGDFLASVGWQVLDGLFLFNRLLFHVSPPLGYIDLP
jgi:hypothetical protein